MINEIFIGFLLYVSNAYDLIISMNIVKICVNSKLTNNLSQSKNFQPWRLSESYINTEHIEKNLQLTLSNLLFLVSL